MFTEVKRIRENWPQIKALIAPEEAERSSIRFVNFCIDHRCNLGCVYCKVAKQNIPPMEEIERPEAFRRLKGICSDEAVLSIVGGEPSRRPAFLVRVITDATNAGFYVNLTTNGFKVDKNLIENLGEIRGPNGQYLRQIAISVDTDGPKNDLPKALGILSMVKEQGIWPVVNTVISAHTDINSFRKLADEVINHGFFIVPQIVSPEIKGGAFSSADFDEIPTKRQIREFMPYLLKKKYTTGQVITSFGYLWAVTKLLWSEDGRPGIWHCLPNFRGYHKRGRGYIAMDSDGYIGPCQEFPRQFNILETNLEELSIELLDALFRKITQQCRGCYHNCYISEDELRGPRSAVGEVTTALAMAKVIK